ncbi:ATP-dependent RNA helicase HrpA [Brevibacterium ravenspurgense]|uniref:ATP-dependent RNA helicase HrpA n=1 Tax=Brevibacterium ravenspurgense TaxID=479117 RepID=A0A2I1IEQ0_9MICO|nr:ATP-dependent RNA helicase HrpA [Brevibacterium ravenspurgense]PKY69604.1 ATP-dependent RNA helicase HrpA [Brevibacterium ravenspurgense]
MSDASSSQPSSRRSSRRRGKRRRARGSSPQQAERLQRLRQARLRTDLHIEYPDELPVSSRRDDIAQAIKDNQVVVVAGETGSGKTTQLPKILLELGYGINGLIGHTQPRRIAARSVAARLAEETLTELGEGVGYQVRFTSDVVDATRVKVMTDGILLAELQHDKRLEAYDAIIIDEAHERSLNIDFLLGYLARLLPKRPDLKVIITSATIDPESFAEHFGDAPIVSVSGRTYPVEIRYRPVDEDYAEDPDDLLEEEQSEPRATVPHVPDADALMSGLLRAVDELDREAPGDILVFLSGEAEIRDAQAELEGHMRTKRRNWEIVPLYGRLSSGEQQRVFAPHSTPRIVLATNVAETSLTVPGIKYVIDGGTARISRYSTRTKVQRLPIEPISQASARQRSGRSGRTSNGIAIRLYSEGEFDARPEYTDPEILRTNLASVLLMMAQLGFVRTEKDILDFPFLTPPEPRAVKNGKNALVELGALRESGGTLTLTKLGRTLATLPLDPRLARMVLAGIEAGVGPETAVIVAFLSGQDPRERPTEQRQEADEKHKRFHHPSSDFLSVLRLWNYVQRRSDELSTSKFKKLCKSEFIHFVRVREWQDLVQQIRQMLGNIGKHIDRPGSDLGTRPSETAQADEGRGRRKGRRTNKRGPYTATEQAVHSSLLTGMLDTIGARTVEGKDYIGARGTKFRIFPGSGVFGANPDFVMAAELVETSRLWARTVAAIEPEWVVRAAGELITHSYSEPHWSSRSAAALAYDRMSLNGVPLISDARINYGKIDREAARDLFIRHALIEGDWNEKHAFATHNAQALEKAEALASRLRDRRLLAEDDVLFEFYDERLPENIVSAGHFNGWWKRKRAEEPDFLNIDPNSLLAADGTDLESAADDYPLQVQLADGSSVRLSYAYEPGSRRDGVTVFLSPEQLRSVDADDFSWQVPGLRLEYITALIRSLPKAKRTYFVPAPDVAAEILVGVTGPEDDSRLLNRPAGHALEVLAAELTGRAGGGGLMDRVPITVTPDDFELVRLPSHLRMSFVIRRGRKTLASGENLAELQQRAKNLDAAADRQPAPAPTTPARTTKAKTQTAVPAPRQGIRGWDFGTFPQPVEADGRRFFPALVDEGTSVTLRYSADETWAHQATILGVTRLLSFGQKEAARYCQDALNNTAKLVLGARRTKDSDPLEDAVFTAVGRIVRTAQCLNRTDDHGLPGGGEHPRTEDEYKALQREVASRITGELDRVYQALTRTYTLAADVERTIKNTRSLTVLASITDEQAHLAALLQPGFLTTVAPDYVLRMPAYLEAAQNRLDKLGTQASRDRQFMDRIQQVRTQIDDKLGRVLGSAARDDAARFSAVLPAEWQKVLWDVEELRVSLWAPHVGTAHTVSEQRITKALAKL